MVSEYFSEIEEEYLFKHLEQKKYVKRVMLLLVIVVLVINGYYYHKAYNDYINLKDSNIKYETIIIEEE